MVPSWSRRDCVRLRAMRRGKGGAVTLLWNSAVKRVALARHATKGTNDALHLGRRHLLSMRSTGRSRDRLVHQRAAEIVGSAAQTGLHALAAHLYPGGLNVGDERIEGEPRNRVHQHRLAEGGAAPAAAFEIDLGLRMHDV